MNLVALVLVTISKLRFLFLSYKFAKLFRLGKNDQPSMRGSVTRWLFIIQSLAIYNNDALLNSIKTPKLVQKFAKY